MFFDFYNVSMKKTVEKSSLRFFTSIESSVFRKLTKWVNGKYYWFASRYWSSSPKIENSVFPPNGFSEKTQKISLRDEKGEDDNGVNMSRGEVKMVMEKLGIFCSEEEEDEEDEESISFDYSINEFSKLFDENEPSIKEVKEAFDVFDTNRDGFIDAYELQRVLCELGLKEGENIESCEKMIESFDLNKDGRIDFDEFAKFMESTV